MSGPEMLTRLDASMLAAAFPESLRSDAVNAGESVLGQLHERQWTERFALQVEGQVVLIPARLHFASSRSDDPIEGNSWLMTRCLRTRSNDGFERQRAARDLLTDVRPWSAPFIVDLIGGYVIEILLDVEAELSPALANALAAFTSANPDYWQLTRQRVASYWNVYYRASFTRADYVGFRLVDSLDAAARARNAGSASPVS